MPPRGRHRSLADLSDQADQDRRVVQHRRERRDSTAHELKNKVTSVAAMFNAAHGSPVRRPSVRGHRNEAEDEEDSDDDSRAGPPAPPRRTRVGFAGVPDNAGAAARLSRRPNLDSPGGGGGGDSSDEDSEDEDENTRFGFGSDSEGSESD